MKRKSWTVEVRFFSKGWVSRGFGEEYFERESG